MVCDLRSFGLTPLQRRKQIQDALARLAKQLKDGTVKVKIGANGGVAFVGDWQRDGVSDTCAYRRLKSSGSPELRAAVAKAEAEAGRKVDENAVAAGTHSHDGGNTWHKGH